ncbi:DUF2089 domain-containing protein [bacterium]|nr:DUF2089 domain-containing protein [bacterium]
MLNKCPICEGKLDITEVHCKKCGTKISGRFPMSNILNLPPEQMEFAIVFLKNRGNIKDVEKELGVSYPTVRSRLDDVITALGFQPRPADSEHGEILEKLEKQEISVDEALKIIDKREKL